MVTFVPTSGPPSKKKKKKIHHSKKDHDDKTNEIPMDNNDNNNDLLSAVKLSSSTSKKRARSGYHSSTGPGDFMKKTYTSNLLSVHNKFSNLTSGGTGYPIPGFRVPAVPWRNGLKAS